MSLLIFKAAIVFILHFTLFLMKENRTKHSDINSLWCGKDASTEKCRKWRAYEWEGQRRMSQGHVQCVYVCMNEGGGAWWFGRVDKETACGRLSASS